MKSTIIYEVKTALHVMHVNYLNNFIAINCVITAKLLNYIKLKPKRITFRKWKHRDSERKITTYCTRIHLTFGAPRSRFCSFQFLICLNFLETILIELAVYFQKNYWHEVTTFSIYARSPWFLLVNVNKSAQWLLLDILL